MGKFKDNYRLLTDNQSEEVKRLFERHNGSITIPVIAVGITAVLHNALSLFDDAKILIAADRFGRAQSLLVAAMEEVGKISVLASMSRIPDSNSVLWGDAWESFRSHEHKSTWAFSQTYEDTLRESEGLLMCAGHQQEGYAPLCERLRQLGLYVDLFPKEMRWLTPDDITLDDATQWRNRAESAISRATLLFEAGVYSVRGLEIQHEVYGDLYTGRKRRKDTSREEAMLIVQRSNQFHRTYYKRLVDEGLLDEELVPTGA